jgi:hypothetical protein
MCVCPFKGLLCTCFCSNGIYQQLANALNDGGFSTPIKKASVPLSVSQMLPLIQLTIHDGAYWFIFMLKCSSFTPECEENLKPKLGMIFEGLEAVENFYKSYAHESAFGVRVGQ